MNKTPNLKEVLSFKLVDASEADLEWWEELKAKRIEFYRSLDEELVKLDEQLRLLAKIQSPEQGLTLSVRDRLSLQRNQQQLDSVRQQVSELLEK